MYRFLSLLVLILLVTGCAPAEFDKVCTIKTNSSNITDTEKKDITYNSNDEVTKIIVTRTYKVKNEEGKNTLENIKKASTDYNNDLISKAIKIEIVTDNEEEYQIKYYLNVLKMTDKELEIFDIRTNSIKYFNVLKNNGVECKKAN